jgi:histidinol dehydrogenase
MRTVKFSEVDFNEQVESIIASATTSIADVSDRVVKIIDEVKRDGDDALIRHIGMFDGWTPENADALMIDESLIEAAYNDTDDELKEALILAYERIKAFHEKQMPKSWIDFESNGSMLGQKVTPVDCAGLYIPGGKASYPSSMLMNAIPAKVAGVEEIVACVPTPGDELNPLVLAAAYVCGVTKIFKVGGASAIAAMAYGTGSIPKADVITGPGNIYVATAKKLLFGEVNIDMIAGPSEIGVLADESADAALLAMDLLSQAEHDEMARSILITDSETLATEVAVEIEKALAILPRAEIARKSIESNGVIIVAQDMAHAVATMNRLAPEHLEIMTANPHELLPLIKHAGAIFLGNNTPEAIGDYVAGPNHTLPTSGTARFFSPLGVENFLKKSSIISMSKQGLEEVGPAAAMIAGVEGLDAHRLSVELRLKK